MAKVSVPEEAVAYNIANSLGVVLDKRKGKYDEAKVFYLAALEGQRRVLGEEHKKTLDSLNNMGVILAMMKDYGEALSYYQQALRVGEKVIGKSHPDTLGTIMNMAAAYGDGLGDKVKEEEMYMLALDGYERSLGKEHEDTKRCARNMAILLCWKLKSKEKTQAHIKEYPALLKDSGGLERQFQEHLRNFIR